MICIPAENAYVSADSSDCLLLVLLLACCILQNKLSLMGQYKMKWNDQKQVTKRYILSVTFGQKSSERGINITEIVQSLPQPSKSVFWHGYQ